MGQLGITGGNVYIVPAKRTQRIMARLELPNAADIVDDWTQGATQNASDFVQSALDSSSEWLEAASSEQAQSNYVNQMQDPDVLQRRQDNITDASRSNYEESLNSFGQSRYQSGVQEGGDEFQDAMNTIFQAVEGTQIPERGTPMSASNIQRFEQVAQAFHEAGQQT